MKRLNKVLAALLALVMVLAMLPMTALAADYDDTTGHWAKDQIDRWTDEGVVQGDENGDFNPNDGMTRAAAAKVFADLLKLKGEADLSAFTDVDPTAWYATDGYLAKAVKAGIIKGTGDTTMSPNDDLTREQLFVMMGRALGIKPAETANKQFTDEAKTSDWAEGYINALVNMGVINGTNDGTTMEPKITINRASVMCALDNAIGGYANEDGDTVEIVEGKVTLVVADNVKVEGAADPDLPIVVTGEAGSVDMKGVTGEATVQVQASDVAIKNAPVGTTVEAAEDAADVTVNGTTVPEDGEVTVKPAPKPTPTPSEYTYIVIFDATRGKHGAFPTTKPEDDTCYGGENWQVGADNNSKFVKVTFTSTASSLTLGRNGLPADPAYETEALVFECWSTTADSKNEFNGDTTIYPGTTTVYALWLQAGTDGQTCYGGENTDTGNYKDNSESYPAAPTAIRVIFDASQYGTLDLSDTVKKDPTCWGGDNTCWGGENTCWGGENEQMGVTHGFAVTTANYTNETLLSQIIADPATIFSVALNNKHANDNLEGGSWQYVKDGIVSTNFDYKTAKIADLQNSNGDIILLFVWNVKGGNGQTCNGGQNSDTGYNTSSTVEKPDPSTVPGA